VTVAPWRPVSRLVALDGSGAAQQLEPRAAARLVTAALADEPGGVLVRPSPRVQAILSELPPGLPVVGVLPDIPQLVRDVADEGTARAAFRRLRRRSLVAWLRLALTGLRHLPAVARHDFRGIVPVLIELERARLGAAPPHAVALAAPLTDLLLAAGHVGCLTHVVRFLRKRVRTQAGFETLNLGHLLPRLAAWGVSPDFVIGPLNPRGFRMKPSARAVLEAIHRSPTPVLASEVSAGGTVALASGVAHARAHGAAGVVLTLDEIPAEASPAPRASRSDGVRGQ